MTRDSLSVDAEVMATQYPGAAEWVRDLEAKDDCADVLYTRLYIHLRRWVWLAALDYERMSNMTKQILINEMSLRPFHKYNCIAMLNTLYPPVTTVSPTKKLTPSILAKQRNGFFRYIQAVETRGPGVLETLEKQGALDGEENGWPEVRRTLEKYLRVANSTIAQCQDITNVSFSRPSPDVPLPNIPVHVIPRNKDDAARTPQAFQEG